MVLQAFEVNNNILLSSVQCSFNMTATLDYELTDQLTQSDFYALLSLINFTLESKRLSDELLKLMVALFSEGDLPEVLNRAVNSIGDQNILSGFIINFLTLLNKNNLSYNHSILNIASDYCLKINPFEPEKSINIDAHAFPLLELITKICWDKNELSILVNFFKYYEKEKVYSILPRLLKISCLHTDNNRVWSFLLKNALSAVYLFIPELFPTDSEDAIGCVAAYMSLKPRWVVELQNYRLFHLPAYLSYVRHIVQNRSLSDNIKYFILVLASRTWDTLDKSRNLILSVENLLQNYDQITVEQFLQQISDNSLKLTITISFLNDVIKNILEIDKLETANFSATQEIVKIFSDFPIDEWISKLSNLSARIFQIKYPEKDIELVMEEFRKQDFPLSIPELFFAKSIYQSVLKYASRQQIELVDKNTFPLKIQELLTSKVPPEEFLIRYLALVRQAIFLTRGYYPYNTQLFVVIAFLTNKQGKGRIAQVKTGQGKSIIVATIAAYYGIQGKYGVARTSPINVTDTNEVSF
jgi:hypothetical protein